MLTIMIHARIHEAKLDQFLGLIQLLVRKTTKEGCHFYRFNQNKDDPLDFVLYEQWESQQALDRHMAELVEILGPTRPGEPIPAKLMDMYEKATPVFYNVIA